MELVEPASPNYLSYTTYGRVSLPIASDEPKSFAFLFELPSLSWAQIAFPETQAPAHLFSGHESSSLWEN